MSTKKREILSNRYSLLDDPRTGGTASVYRARDHETDQLVAIKRFDRDKLLPEIEAEAYRREVEALRNLIHPNILLIHDTGVDDQHRPYLVLEWMAHDLIDCKTRGTSAFNGWDDFADQVAFPLAEALAHAHANGYCHRDVKPGNVLLGDSGEVKLADFGVSKLKRCLQPRITLNEFVSRPYAPPEPDDGAYTYARDVYAFAVLCIWALSSRQVSDYTDLAPALGELDVVKEVRELLARCLSDDPKMRPQTAGVLAHELAKIQSRRRQVWAAQDRKRSRVKLTRKAGETVAAHIEKGDENTVHRFVEQDLNDEATIARYYSGRGTPDEKIVNDNYYVYGSQFSYHLVFGGGPEVFDIAIVSARQWEPHRMQQFKESTLQCPMGFSLSFRPSLVSAKDAGKLLEQLLAEFEDKKKAEVGRVAEESLFGTWKKVLDARSAFEREKVAPIVFSKSEVRGEFVTLYTDGDLVGVEVEQPRIVVADRSRFPGEVYEIAPDRVVLNCAGCDLSKFPKAGRARFDTSASDIALDRQRTAVEAIRSGTSVRGDLRKLLLDPSKVSIPAQVNEDLKIDPKDLDESQRDSLIAALGTKDILIVQGPPGTGKTRFISQLIRETLARDPNSRILLSSQTHVAIDNALERIADASSGLRILRIARPNASVVADTSRPYLVDNQLSQWRQQVATGSSAWLHEWASTQGLNPDDIAAGSQLRQIAHLRQRIVEHRGVIKDLESKMEPLRNKEATLGPAVADGDLETFEREADELRQQLDSDRRVLEQREISLRKMRKQDADQFLKLGHEELSEWSGVLVGNTNEGRRAEALLDLQSQWLDRFGRGPSFLGALCERSDVVAATCIGLASLPGTSEVVYDLCIIDEASKATATEVLVPMTRARRWVFVGDSRQLPPFEAEVHRDQALRRRFEIDTDEAAETLFELLRKLLPSECQKMLRKQYRMVPAIGRLVSDCFYEGELESAIRDAEPRLTSVTTRPVAWVTTRYLDDRTEEKADGSFVNPIEADRILDLLEDFEDVVSDSDDRITVQILSGYSAQVRHLQRTIDRCCDFYAHLDIECSTIDTVQGREADVVIFSVTRSNQDNRAGFLGEFARINVALSRARETLVIVGDDEFIRRAPGAEPLRKALHHIEQHPKDCVFQSFDPPGHGKGVRK